MKCLICEKDLTISQIFQGLDYCDQCLKGIDYLDYLADLEVSG